MNTTLGQDFEHFIEHGYEVVGVVLDGARLESYRVRPWYDKIHTRICELADNGYSFSVVTKMQDGICYWLAVNSKYEGEIDMTTVLPTFKDLVADEVAKYLQIQQERLLGDENPTFVLDRIIGALRDGDWKRYENVNPKGNK